MWKVFISPSHTFFNSRLLIFYFIQILKFKTIFLYNTISSQFSSYLDQFFFLQIHFYSSQALSFSFLFLPYSTPLLSSPLCRFLFISPLFYVFFSFSSFNSQFNYQLLNLISTLVSILNTSFSLLFLYFSYTFISFQWENLAR